MLDIFLLSMMTVARALQSFNETTRIPVRDVFQISKALIVKKLLIEKSKA